MIAVPVVIDTASVRRGDQLLIAGQAFTVLDILGQPRGGKCLDLGNGVHLVIQPDTILYATRIVQPRRAMRGSAGPVRNKAGGPGAER